MSSTPFVLLSDLDDTLKISHSTSHFRTVLRGLFTHDAYAGMAELYREMIGTHSSLTILSSSPRVIRPKIEKFLNKNGFPKAEILLRDWIRQPEILKYKTEALKRITSQSKVPFIFVGDDTEWDPEVFATLQTTCPEKILKIYIRRMRGRPLPDGMEPFHTAYEIALSEMTAGRLTPEQVIRVGHAIANAQDLDHVIPYFAVCPENISSAPTFPELADIHSKILAKLMLIYERRKIA